MRGATIAIILALSLLLFACGPNGPGEAENYHTGTKGIAVEFLEDYPEQELLEEKTFPVVLHVENEGAADVAFDKMKLTFTYDPLYIEEASGDMNVWGSADSIFHGRSEYYPQGDAMEFEIFRFSARKLVGQRQAVKTQFGAQLCYEYNTTYVEEICIDVDKYLRSGREQVCEAEDLRSSGQGGPVAFTHVEVRNDIIPTTGYAPFVRPEFVIEVSNVGQGVVVSPHKQNFDDACISQGIDKNELNAVRVRARVLGVDLECRPELVSMRDNKGTTRCTIPDDQINNPALSIQQNFHTPLVLEATYIYRASEILDLTILNDPYDDDGYLLDPDDNPGTQDVPAWMHDEDTSKCEYYAANPGAATGSLQGQVDANWGCKCSKEQCQELDDMFTVVSDGGKDADGNELPDTEEQRTYCGYQLCPGSTYCCDLTGYNKDKKDFKRD